MREACQSRAAAKGASAAPREPFFQGETVTAELPVCGSRSEPAWSPAIITANSTRQVASAITVSGNTPTSGWALPPSADPRSFRALRIGLPRRFTVHLAFFGITRLCASLLCDR